MTKSRLLRPLGRDSLYTIDTIFPEGEVFKTVVHPTNVLFVLTSLELRRIF